MIHHHPIGYQLLLAGSVLFGNSPALAGDDSGAELTDALVATSDLPGDSSPDAGAGPIAPKDARRRAFELIEVRGERTRDHSVLAQPQAIGLLTRQELERNNGLFLEDSLNLLPGVRMESRTLSGGQRITIRGYGNGTNFDTSTLGRVEVIRGPASSLYGSGIAGVVKMFTLRPDPQTTRFTGELIGGTQSLLRTNGRMEHGTDNSSVLVNYGHQHSDGYRIHSQSKKDYALFSADFDASSKQSISVYGAFNHSFEELAGQLTADQFATKQNAFEPAYLQNNAHVAINSVRFGASHSYEFHHAVSNVTSVYVSGYQLDQAFAGGRTDNLVLNYGGRTEFDLRFGGPSFGLNGAIGTEFQQTSAFKKSYNFNFGALGGIRGDLQVAALQSNSFMRWDLLLPYEFTLTAGTSLNFVHYNIKDRLANSANPLHADQSGAKDFSSVVTPRAAVSKAFGRQVMVYAQVSLGYSPPTSGSVVIPQIGAVNTDLKPERATLYEIGSKGNLLEGRLSYEIALFDMLVQDKFTPKTLPDSTGALYTFTTNAGSQTNLGLELATKYAVINDRNSPVSLLQPFASYTLSQFTYDNFKSDNNNDARTVDYNGKKVVGVPANILNLGLDFALRWGIYLNGTYQYVDSMPLTYDNTQRAKSYSLLSAKVGYRRDLDRHFRLDVFAGGNNLLGSLYYTMVFLNANYSGPRQPNVYLPGPYKATFYGGVNLSYSL